MCLQENDLKIFKTGEEVSDDSHHVLLCIGIDAVCFNECQAILFDFRTQWIALFFCILTVTANISPVTISLLRETNTPNVTGVSVSFLNFGNYIMVALLGTAAGLLMDLFPPQICGQTQIYGRDSYLTVFSLLFLLSCIVCGSAFRLRETNGINCASTTH